MILLGIPNTYPLQTSAQKLAGKPAQWPPPEKETVSSILMSSVGSMQRFGRKVARSVVIAFRLPSSLLIFFIDLHQGCEELKWDIYQRREAQQWRSRIRTFWAQKWWYSCRSSSLVINMFWSWIINISKEFGIDIVGQDNETIIHHRVAARVVCVFSEQDVK